MRRVSRHFLNDLSGRFTYERACVFSKFRGPVVKRVKSQDEFVCLLGAKIDIKKHCAKSALAIMLGTITTRHPLGALGFFYFLTKYRRM